MTLHEPFYWQAFEDEHINLLRPLNTKMIPCTKKCAQSDEEIEKNEKIEAKKEVWISVTSATKCTSTGKILKSGTQIRIHH